MANQNSFHFLPWFELRSSRAEQVSVAIIFFLCVARLNIPLELSK